MERTNTAVLNGHGRKSAVIEAEVETQERQNEENLLKESPSTVPQPIADEREPQLVPVDEKAQHPEPSPRKRKPKKLILAALGLGAIVAGTFGYRWWQYSSTHEETDNATVIGHIHQVSTRINGTVADVEVTDNEKVHKGQLLVELDPRDYQTKVLQAQAALDAAKRQANAALANITLAAQTTEAKTSQAQGDVTGAVASISTAQAAVTEAQAGVPTAQAAVAEAQAGIPAAQAQVAQAQATLQQAETDYNRYQTLYQQGAIARQQLDAAKAAYEVARAQKSSAEQGVQQARARLAQSKEGVARAQAKLAQAQQGVTSAQAKLAASKGGLQQATASGQQTEVNRAQYEAAKAAIAQAEGNLREAQLQLSYTNITAPADGLVGRKSVEVGQRVQPGTPLMAIVGDDHWIVANFKETQLEEMKPGQEVEIKLDALPHHTFTGRIESLSPASGAQFALLPPDNATGNFTKVVQRIPVKITFSPDSIRGYESRITPGMSATVSVELK